MGALFLSTDLDLTRSHPMLVIGIIIAIVVLAIALPFIFGGGEEEVIVDEVIYDDGVDEYEEEVVEEVIYEDQY